MRRVLYFYAVALVERLGLYKGKVMIILDKFVNCNLTIGIYDNGVDVINCIKKLNMSFVVLVISIIESDRKFHIFVYIIAESWKPNWS